MKKTRFILLTVLAALAMFIVFEKTSGRAFSLGSNPPKNIYFLKAVISLIRNDYLEEKDPAQTIEGSFKGLVNSLDSYSGYLNAESTARYLSQKDAPIKETGTVLFKRYGGFPQVIGLTPNSPAEKQGLQFGDLITEIDGRATPAMSLAEVNLYLRGSEEKPVELKVLRGEKTIEVRLERTLLFPEPFLFKSQEGTAGVLQVARLAPPLVDTLQTKILSDLQKAKNTLIIDLRNCQEGTFEEAREFINLFLQAESLGYFEKRGETKEVLSSPGEPRLAKLPLIVWINQATLGPAEAVAAVLKEFKRAKVVGLPTLGMAAWREFFPLEDGTSVILTTGIFCLNSGVKLWGQGAAPDVELEIENQSFETFLQKTQPLLSSS
ncbi:MAG: S41 family peptidase [Acidobacteriota bacterium]